MKRFRPNDKYGWVTVAWVLFVVFVFYAGLKYMLSMIKQKIIAPEIVAAAVAFYLLAYFFHLLNLRRQK